MEMAMTLHIQHCIKKELPEHVELLPSTKVYFGEFPYRVRIKGPGHPHKDYDPHFHYDITDFMRSSNMFYKRELQSSGGRNIYFALYDDLMWFVNWMGDSVEAVHGPLSEQHILDMHTPGLIIRENNWYKDFDYRVEFNTPVPRTYSTHQPATQEEVRHLINWVHDNFDNYRWGTVDFKWFYNYLYCDYNEYNDLRAICNLQFKKLIRREDKIKLFSEL